MKKFVTIICAIVLSISVCIANKSESTVSNNLSTSSELYAAANVRVPTGVFFNGSDFVRVESSWVRICIDRVSEEYDFNAERDPYGNYVLVLIKRGNYTGESIMIYPNGMSLYYDDVKYTKKSRY